MSTPQLFAAYEAKVDRETLPIPAFFIESTAPNNLDDKDGGPVKTPDYCVEIPTPQAAIDRIAEKLAEQRAPKLVITVHGFNSPRDAVLETYKKSFLAVNQDTAIHGRGVVCVGYRWPSERMGTPWSSGLSAAPWFLLGTLFAALGAVYFVNFVLDLCGLGNSVRIPVTAVTGLDETSAASTYFSQLHGGAVSIPSDPRRHEAAAAIHEAAPLIAYEARHILRAQWLEWPCLKPRTALVIAGHIAT